MDRQKILVCLSIPAIAALELAPFQLIQGAVQAGKEDIQSCDQGNELVQTG